MKAFFSSIIKPKEKPSTNPPTSTPPSVTNTTAATLTPAVATQEASATNAATTSATASITPTPTPSPPPAVITADALLTPPPASATTRQIDKKHARLLLDDYIALMNTLFDHSIPIKKETEYFLEQFDDWVGRDPVTELPKVHQAARTVNMELPLVREKGTLNMQELNAQIGATIATGNSFLSSSASKDDLRRDLIIPSLARLKSVQAACEKELAEARKAQHEGYVKEFKALHDKYGRNMDGSFKTQPILVSNMESIPTSTPIITTATTEIIESDTLPSVNPATHSGSVEIVSTTPPDASTAESTNPTLAADHNDNTDATTSTPAASTKRPNASKKSAKK